MTATIAEIANRTGPAELADLARGCIMGSEQDGAAGITGLCEITITEDFGPCVYSEGVKCLGEKKGNSSS